MKTYKKWWCDMNFDDNDKIDKEKGKMYALTTLFVIGVFVILVIVGIFSMSACFVDMGKHKYYLLEVNKENKEQIISLLEQENKPYCESIYKIEYEQLFPNDKSVKVYCKKEADIKFSISDNEESELANYIFENGETVRR